MYFSKRSIIKSKGSKFRITEGTFALWGWAYSIPREGRKIPLTVIPSATHLCQTTGAWLPRYTELARMTVVQALVEIRQTRVREVSVLLRRSSHTLSTTIHSQLSPIRFSHALILLDGKHCPLLLYPKVLRFCETFFQVARCNTWVLAKSFSGLRSTLFFLMKWKIT